MTQGHITPEVSFLIPCLNEELTIPYVIQEIKESFAQDNLEYEILVADNGSTDSSRDVALSLGARVVDVPEPGYGSALLGGIKASRGSLVVMGDADGSYHFEDSIDMLVKLRSGDELVIGNRFKGGIAPGAMPLLHKYLGNPVLSFIARLFYDIPLGDFHCGLRAFKKEAILKVGLKSKGMEFASEMIVKARIANLKISEVPVRLSPDKRDRAPHLRTWRDGWRHLKFLFAHSPKWAMKIPAITSLVLAILPLALTFFGSAGLGLLGTNLSYKSGLFSMALSIFSANLFWAFAVSKEIDGEIPSLTGTNLRFLSISSFLLTLAGLGILSIQALDWAVSGFGPQSLGGNLYLGIFATFLISIGATSLTFSLILGFIRVKAVDSSNHD